MEQLRFGSIVVDAVSDGELAFPLERMFPGVESAAFARHGGLTPGGALSSPLTTFVVRAPGGLVLVDTGLGPDIGPLARFGFEGHCGLLPRAMEAAGISPAVVAAVVLTHLHSDHIGWNTVEEDGRLRPLFPNARYIVTRTEWAHRATVAGRRTVARSLEPVEASGQLTLVDDGYEVVPGVSLVATPGHTPGHACVLIRGGAGEAALITGDAVHHPAEIEDPSLSPPFDADPVQSAASRRALVERAEAEGLVILGGHFPPPIAGHVARVAERRAWRWLGS